MPETDLANPQSNISHATGRSFNYQRRRGLYWLGLFICAGICLYTSQKLSQSRNEIRTAPVETSVEDDPAPASNTVTPPTAPQPEKVETAVIQPEQLEGRWLRSGSIRREVEMKSGGQATMNLQLDYLSGLVYGRETNVQMSWQLKDGILSHRIVTGTPKANIDRIIRDFGDSISYRVVSVSENELVLEDLADNSRDRWAALK